MSDYPAGTIAVATVRGVQDVRVMRDDMDSNEWMSAVRVHGFRFLHCDDDVTDIRPLVVLDFEDPAEAVRHLRTVPTGWDIAGDIADQIEEQTKPPRMAEPGWQPQVTAHTREDSERRCFTRYTEKESGYWIDRLGMKYRWYELIDPSPVQP